MNLPSSLTKTFDPKLLDLFSKKDQKEPDIILSPQTTHITNIDIRQEEITNAPPPPPPPPSKLRRWKSKTAIALKRHVHYIGPGIIASVAYIDPGNWVTDLSAGSQFGYKLCFTILMAGLFGIFLQILAVRLGCVTGSDLARGTRLLCLPEGPDGQVKPDLRWRKSRTALLWLNYAVAEGAIIATELAELIGSGIALNLLFPKLPVWGGIIVTCADVFVILLVIRPNGNVRVLEILIGTLVIIVMASFIALLVRVKPVWSQVFDGFVPSKTLVGTPEALYASIGIIGAVIMPHSLYLGSHIATIDRLPEVKEKSSEILAKTEGNAESRWKSRAKRVAAIIDPDMFEDGTATSNRIREPKKLTIAQKKIHILHASWDVGLSLFTFSIFINSAILVVAAAAFYYGTGSRNVSDLYDAFNLLRDTLGYAYAVLFAIALLAAGQSASITVTIAGGLVSEGFIKWKTNLFVRRLITRGIVMVPSLVISIAVGRNGLEQTLVASQVALSFALPIVLIPLLIITSLKSRMQAEDDVDTEAQDPSGIEATPSGEATQTPSVIDQGNVDKIHKALPSIPNVSPAAETPSTSQLLPEQPFLASIRTITHDFSSPKIIIAAGVVIYLVILMADIYSLVTL